MQKNEIVVNIVFASDDYFSILLGVALCSIFENKKIISHNIKKNLFLIKNRKIIFPKFTRIFLSPVAYFANKFPLRYEQYFAYIFQAENVYLELMVVK